MQSLTRRLLCPLNLNLLSSLHLNLFPGQSYLKIMDYSKKLSPKKRVEALSVIKSHSLSLTSAFISHTVIDGCNINIATEKGIHKLLAKSEVKPDVIIMDGNFKFQFDIPFISVIKGDNRSISIASASIVAKVLRDELMDKLHLKYPGYGFVHNKGYGTRDRSIP